MPRLPRYEMAGIQVKTGFITDSKGKKIYLSESIIILTAELESSSKKIVGFIDPVRDTKKEYRDMVRDMLSNDFAQSINLICNRIPVSGAATWGWIKSTLLTGLADKYKYHGIEVLWDESLQYWCFKNEISCTC